MGAIQNAVNSGLSGTAFLLNQSGALEGFKQNYKTKKNIERIQKAADAKEAAIEQGLKEAILIGDKADVANFKAEISGAEREKVQKERDELISEERLANEKTRYDEMFKQEETDVRTNAVYGWQDRKKEKALASLRKAAEEKANAEAVKQRREEFTKKLRDGTL